MSTHPLLGDPNWEAVNRKVADTNLHGRQRYEATPSGVIDDAGPSLLLEYWYMLRRRKGTLLLIASVGLLGSVLLAFSQTPVYRARTTLEIQNLNENFLNMHSVSPTSSESAGDAGGTDLQTQINILQSESVLGGVIAKPDLRTKLLTEKDKGRFAWRNAWPLARSKPASTTEDILPLMAANLKVSMQANTRIVEILYDSTDPVLAADIANTLTTEFIRQNIESRWQTTQKTGEWLTGQMAGVRNKLERSEDELQAYARKAGLLFTSEKDNVVEEKLRQVQQELSKAQADRVAAQSKYELMATASADSLPEVLDDATLKDYQVKLTDLRRQLAELSSALTPVHPSVKKTEAQVATLQEAMEKERANVTRRIQNEFESAQRREKLLAASYDAQTRVMTGQADKVTHYNTLKSEVDNNRQIYNSMLQHVREAGIASTLQASNVRVIDPARPPTRPYKPNVVLNSIFALFAGGFLGIVFIVIRERADRSIQAPGEASLYLGVPELGVIPSADPERGRTFASYRLARGCATKTTENENRKGGVELVTWQKGPSVLADSFRSTLTSILYTGENGSRPRVIALTSASAGEGKTTVASNLALALAEIGRRVLLIDGDLRKPRLHEIFGVSNSWGLSDLLNGIKPPEGSEAMVVGTGCRDLCLLPSGSVPSSIADLLHSPRALELLQRMRREFDMVIIDTPPMLHMPDARILGRMADGVILVVRSARTTKEAATAASQRLVEDGTRFLGTVLNEWDPNNTAHTGYDYGHGAYQYDASRTGRG